MPEATDGPFENGLTNKIEIKPTEPVEDIKTRDEDFEYLFQELATPEYRKILSALGKKADQNLTDLIKNTQISAEIIAQKIEDLLKYKLIELVLGFKDVEFHEIYRKSDKKSISVAGYSVPIFEKYYRLSSSGRLITDTFNNFYETVKKNMLFS